FGNVIPWKTRTLVKAASRFRANATGEERRNFEQFCTKHSSWLSDFALFMACKAEYEGLAWPRWPAEVAQRTQSGLEAARDRLQRQVEVVQYWQFEFCRQWKEVQAHAHSCGIRVVGDVPIYVALDSADVWANREYFELSEDGQPLKIAGVPPDYF